MCIYTCLLIRSVFRKPVMYSACITICASWISNLRFFVIDRSGEECVDTEWSSVLKLGVLSISSQQCETREPFLETKAVRGAPFHTSPLPVRPVRVHFINEKFIPFPHLRQTPWSFSFPFLITLNRAGIPPLCFVSPTVSASAVQRKSCVGKQPSYSSSRIELFNQSSLTNIYYRLFLSPSLSLTHSLFFYYPSFSTYHLTFFNNFTAHIL